MSEDSSLQMMQAEHKEYQDLEKLSDKLFGYASTTETVGPGTQDIVNSNLLVAIEIRLLRMDLNRQNN